MERSTKDYEDLLQLPHHVSSTHRPMPMRNRAAQFAPFAALTGYENMIAETARLTDERPQADEEDLAALNRAFYKIEMHLKERPLAEFSVFQTDMNKKGGKTVDVCQRVRRLDTVLRKVFLEDGRILKMDDILAVRLPEIPEEEID